MSDTTPPTVLVIIGITGDLSQRKLLPAVEKIVAAGAVDTKLFKVVGVTRRDIPVTEVLKGVKTKTPFLSDNLVMCQMNLAELDDYKLLEKQLAAINAELGTSAQRLFYLSVPPQVSRPIVELLGESGLAKDAKLLLEKPFGTDLASARELVEQTKVHFDEDQIYRIDHYLAKEMSQNLIVFREQNSLFKRTWSSDFIEKITIIASEKIGIEGRAAFYEQTGALRDLVQSHLLQLAALTLMDVPKASELDQVPRARLQALRQLYVPTDPHRQYAVRGQYKGYTDEVENPDSLVETFADITLFSEHPRWQGVPVRLITGKALDQKATEICITYKREQSYEANQLRIRLQPDEGVELSLWTKTPGYQWHVEAHSLDIAFKDHYPELPEAYEQVIVDAINSNHLLFTSSDEVLESWRIIEPVRQAWSMSEDDLLIYEPGDSPEKIKPTQESEE